MIVRSSKKVATATLFVLAFGFAAGDARNEEEKTIKSIPSENGSNAEPQKRNLFQDDEHFWGRFMQESSMSITDEPSASPSQAPTDICEAAVSENFFAWSTKV